MSISFLLLTALSAAALATACGGGTTAQLAPNATPPPTSAASPDFTITISPATLTLTQGGIPQTITISHRTKGQLLRHSPSDTLRFAIGRRNQSSNPDTNCDATTATTSILIGASIATALGSATITAQATSGSLSHSESFSAHHPTVPRRESPALSLRAHRFNSPRE